MFPVNEPSNPRVSKIHNSDQKPNIKNKRCCVIEVSIAATHNNPQFPKYGLEFSPKFERQWDHKDQGVQMKNYQKERLEFFKYLSEKVPEYSDVGLQV
ncbi:hypothetical protein AYI68_g2330 [Smittium mucronatum]|uniref:Uncharacterized protein n=1 Tax=Smittium mucronatum TaxID=133383 RepID=A0A1R0H315_9FUNG|nr:hypothetical protein AYI68_g2330 [Smittium mucronatum]